MRAPSKAPFGIALAIGIMIFSGSLAWTQQLMAPSERWNAVYNEGMDAAFAVDAAAGTIVVAGNRGIVIYEENGDERAVIATLLPQTSVRITGDLIVSGDSSGLTAYTLRGDLVWETVLEGGCVRIETGPDEVILALTPAGVVAVDTQGTIRATEPLDETPSAMCRLGSGNLIALGSRIRRVAGGTTVWERELPFEVADLSVDAADRVWAVGGDSVATISAAGSVLWERTVAATLTGVDTMPQELTGPFRVQWPNSAVVTGYRRTSHGEDFVTLLLNSTGELIWQVVHDSGFGDDRSNDVAVADNGDVVIVGSSPVSGDEDEKDDYLTIRYSMQPVAMDAANGTDPKNEADSSAQGDKGRQLHPPHADFSFSPVTPFAFDWISFTNQSSDSDGMIVAQLWTFDPYHEAASLHARHSFHNSGVYDVTLTVVDDDGLAASCTKAVPVQNRPPVVEWTALTTSQDGELTADFSWTSRVEEHGSYPVGHTPEGITDVDDVVFEDVSTGSGTPDAQFDATADDRDGSIVQYDWDFGDGRTSFESSPAHTYTAPGTYSVRLTVTDNEGAQASYAALVTVGGGSAITSWDWSMGGPGSFQDGTSCSSQHPVHWFSDNSEEGPFEVTLTVHTASGASATATKTLAVANVPPTADFDWSFSHPGDDWLPDAEDYFWTGEGDYVVNGPSIPGNSGLIAFEDLSFDAEPGKSIDDWEWDFDGGHSCELEEDCTSLPSPEVLFTSSEGEGGDTLFRGTRSVTLTVWDDDGEGGHSGASTRTQNVNVANIAPYAGFEWWFDEWNGWSSTDCESGDYERSGSDASFIVTRVIENWSTWDALYTPWENGGSVTLTFEGGGTVQVSETAPSGWTIECWDENLTAVGNSLTGQVDISEGSYEVYYDLYCPDDGTATEGMETISGTFSNEVSGEGEPETYEVSLDSDVMLCLTVDADTEIEFYAYDDSYADSGFVDPNGDSVDFDWDFGSLGSDSGQEIYLYPSFDNLTAQYQEGNWIWEETVDAELTVRDSVGDSTSVSTTIDVWGYCMGGGGE